MNHYKYTYISMDYLLQHNIISKQLNEHHIQLSRGNIKISTTNDYRLYDMESNLSSNPSKIFIHELMDFFDIIYERLNNKQLCEDDLLPYNELLRFEISKIPNIIIMYIQGYDIEEYDRVTIDYTNKNLIQKIMDFYDNVFSKHCLHIQMKFVE